jgi:hypothetical protein
MFQDINHHGQSGLNEPLLTINILIDFSVWTFTKTTMDHSWKY